MGSEKSASGEWGRVIKIAVDIWKAEKGDLPRAPAASVPSRCFPPHSQTRSRKMQMQGSTVAGKWLPWVRPTSGAWEPKEARSKRALVVSGFVLPPSFVSNGRSLSRSRSRDRKERVRKAKHGAKKMENAKSESPAWGTRPNFGLQTIDVLCHIFPMESGIFRDEPQYYPTITCLDHLDATIGQQ